MMIHTEGKFVTAQGKKRKTRRSGGAFNEMIMKFYVYYHDDGESLSSLP